MKQHLLLLIFLSVLTFSSCGDVLDCVFNVRPELHEKNLAVGFVSEHYSEIITAEIKNEPNDDDYDYYFDVTGRLPEGIIVSYNRYREVVLKGIPIKSGRFTIEVFLEAIPKEDYGRINGPLCSDHTSRTYVLTIK